jgi:competence protein ComEC
MPTELAAFNTAASSAEAARRPFYQPCLLILAAVAAGMVLDRYYPLSPRLWYSVAIGVTLLWSIAWWQRRSFVATCLLLLAALTAGGTWHHDQWRQVRADEAGLSVTEEIRPIACEAVALTSPRWSPAPPLSPLRTIPKGDETELLVEMKRIRDGAHWRPASGYAMLDVDGHLVGVRAGDRVRLLVLASKPMKPLNPGEFDFNAHERSRRVFVRLRGLFPESVSVVEPGSWWSWRLWLSRMREAGNGVLRQHISPRRSTLAAAILLGAREQLDPDRNEGFLVTGTIHVLSISGLHVGILAYGFWTLFRSGIFPRRPMLWSAIALTILYCLLTDSQPPIVRATILIVVVCVSLLWGRSALGFNSLALAGLVVLAMAPAALFQAGPQLSFLSVAAMILFAPWLTRRVEYDPLDQLIAASRPWYSRVVRYCFGELYRVWLTGVVIWVITLPIVWQQYDLISPIALLINVIVWLPIFASLFAGFGVLLFGPTIPPLGALCGWLCDVSLGAIEYCIDVGQKLPGNHFYAPPPPWWWVAIFYGVFLVWILIPQLKTRKLWAGALLLAWFTIAIFLANHPQLFAASPKDKPLTCTFVAVGHGTAVLLEFPSGQTMLYDAGRLGSPIGAARPISAVLWSRGISHIDVLMISHADTDHFNAVPELLRQHSFGVIYVSPFMFDQTDQPAVNALHAAILQSGVRLDTLSASDKLQIGDDVALEILHPPALGVIGSDNANSLVLLIEHAGRKVLLPGDLESPGLEDLLAELPIDTDLLMAPHHGSARSDPKGFGNWCRPEHVVISGSRDVEEIDAIEAVKRSYSQIGCEVYHTAEMGSVRFEITAAGVKVETFRQVKK